MKWTVVWKQMSQNTVFFIYLSWYDPPVQPHIDHLIIYKSRIAKREHPSKSVNLTNMRFCSSEMWTDYLAWTCSVTSETTDIYFFFFTFWFQRKVSCYWNICLYPSFSTRGQLRSRRQSMFSTLEPWLDFHICWIISFFLFWWCSHTEKSDPGPRPGIRPLSQSQMQAYLLLTWGFFTEPACTALKP